MKINTIKNLLLLFTAVVALTLTSCSEDDGGDGTIADDVAGTLEGTWTSGTVTVNSITIDGQDIAVFLEEFRQLLIELQVPEEEIDALLDEFEEGFSEDFEDLDGSLTFNADGTYEISDTSGTDTGTWALSNNDETLTLDGGTEDELVMNIVSLTDTRFEGLVTEEISEDLDEDGTTNEVAISVTFVLAR